MNPNILKTSLKIFAVIVVVGGILCGRLKPHKRIFFYNTKNVCFLPFHFVNNSAVANLWGPEAVYFVISGHFGKHGLSYHRHHHRCIHHHCHRQHRRQRQLHRHRHYHLNKLFFCLPFFIRTMFYKRFFFKISKVYIISTQVIS